MAGIVPSTTKTYTSAQLEHALGAFRGGVNASIQCTGNQLNQVYYHFHVAGSAQDGIYVPTQPGKSAAPSVNGGGGWDWLEGMLTVVQMVRVRAQ